MKMLNSFNLTVRVARIWLLVVKSIKKGFQLDDPLDELWKQQLVLIMQ